MNRWNSRWILMALPVALAISACGGGGSASNSSTNTLDLNGTVAVGAPLANAKMSFTCAEGGGNDLATTDSNGAYSVKLKATAPCLVSAEGTVKDQKITLSSAATEKGVANVTTMTHLIVATALDGDPGQVSVEIVKEKLTDDSLSKAWTEKVKPWLNTYTTVDIAQEVNYITTAFSPVAGDPIDDALEALSANGITPQVVQEISKGGAAGIEAGVKINADEAQRQACAATSDANPYGSCWRMQTPSAPDAVWAKVTGSTINLGGKTSTFTRAPEGDLQLSGFSKTFASEDFTMQLCNENGSATNTPLKYQLISPKAKEVTEAEWSKVLAAAISDERPQGISLTMQQNCTMLSGEDPIYTGGRTSKEIFKLVLHADGSASTTEVEPSVQPGTDPVTRKEQFTKEQVRDWLFRGKPIGGDDNWDTYAKLYQFAAHDGPLFAISLAQKPHSSTSLDKEPDMFGAGFLIEWDSYD